LAAKHNIFKSTNDGAVCQRSAQYMQGRMAGLMPLRMTIMQFWKEKVELKPA